MKKFLFIFLFFLATTKLYAADGWGGYNTFTKQYRTFNLKNFLPTIFPPCTDTGGNHLNYTLSTNTVSCGTSGGGGGSGDVTDVGDCTSGACFKSGGSGTNLYFKNATSGSITLQTVPGALGTQTISFPAETGTVCTTGSICTGYDNAGLTLVSVTNFSGASDSGTIAITGGVFYRVIMKIVFSTTSYLNMYSDVTNSHGGYFVNYPSNAAVTTTNNGGNVAAYRFGTAADSTVIVGDIMPVAVSPTLAYDFMYNQTYNQPYSEFSTGVMSRKSNTGTITGFNLYPTSGTMTGTVWLYKYKNSL